MTPAIKSPKPDAEKKEEEKTQESGVDQLLSELRQDEDLAVFLEDGFDPARHVGQVVREGRVALALKDAERAHEILSARVRDEVIERKEALIAEVEAVAALEKEVGTVSEGIAELSTASSALVQALEEPYIPMQHAVQRMQNLCDAADLLAALARFRACTSKLASAGLLPIDSSLAAVPAVLPPAAEAMRELETLIAPNTTPKLEKVEGLLKTVMAVRKASPEIRRRATVMLKSGLAERNQVEVEAAVSAFAALGILSDRVSSEIARLLAETQASLHRGLEAPKLPKRSESSSSLKDASDAAASKSIHVWNNVEKMFDSVAEACCKAILLQQVLSKKYSDETHLSLLHEPIASNFIDSIAKALTEQIGVLSRTRQQRPSANTVFMALAEGFPKLRATLTALVSRIEEFARLSPAPITNIAPDPKYPFVPNQAFIENAFFNAVTEVETQYLSVSLQRLIDAVEASFKKRRQPSESEALSFAKVLAQELTEARDDPKLLETATNNVSTALRLFKSHAEDYAAATAPDVDHRKPSRESNEWRLQGLHNGIVTLAIYARRVLGINEHGTGELSPLIEKEVEDLKTLASHFLDVPFSQCRQDVQRSLARMHTENLELDASDEGYSVYVMDVTKFVTSFVESVISPLTKSQILGEKTIQLAGAVLDLFVRHVSLVKPISDVGRLSLSTDIARLELTVESLCPVRRLNEKYQALRAMRSMLLIPVEDLMTPGEPLLNELRFLPKSCLVCALISRANAHALELPHERKGMAVQKYVESLQHLDETAIWENVQSSLQAYAGAVSDQDRCVEFQAIEALLKVL